MTASTTPSNNNQPSQRTHTNIPSDPYGAFGTLWLSGMGDRHAANNARFIEKLNLANTKVDYSNAQNDRQVGDLNSQTKGSGARFNAGKVPYELLPISLIADMADASIEREEDDIKDQAIVVLGYLGLWQERNIENGIPDEHPLLSAILAFEDDLESTARVFEYGKKKYSEFNWAKGMAWSIPLACAVRHLLAILAGDINDPESGLSHVGHVRCNLTMLYSYDVKGTYPEGDNRPDAGMLASIDEQDDSDQYHDFDLGTFPR